MLDFLTANVDKLDLGEYSILKINYIPSRWNVYYRGQFLIQCFTLREACIYYAGLTGAEF